MVAAYKSILEAYYETWAGSLAALLSRLTSASWQPGPTTDANDYVPTVRVRVIGENASNGRQWVGFSQADATELLRICRAQDSSGAADLTVEQREGILGLVRQWAELAAGAPETNLGKVAPQVASEESSVESISHAKLLRVSDGTRSIAALLEIDENLEKAVGPRGQAVDGTPLATASARIEELVHQGNLGLLMDVELNVMLQFGCRQATLSEVLELSVGAVLELDREIQEPVELLLNRRVIARGEVVVLDGNYGLRVTEVASAQQRIDSL